MNGRNHNVGGHSDVAIALSYDGKNTPRVTAKGKQQLAEKIIEAAEISQWSQFGLGRLSQRLIIGRQFPHVVIRGTRRTGGGEIVESR